MNRANLILLLILSLATILRFWQITSVPPSLNWDEASLGYNAYSILQTGKDEYGKSIPAIFKSFGDYKPGLYVYLTTPFVAIFGLNEFSVRATSSVFGVLSVLVLYLLIRDWTGKKNAALAASFILAISPWHLILSRPALESSVAIFFNLLAVYFFFKTIQGKSLFLPLTALSLLASLYTYHGSKIIVPLILFGFVVFGFKKLVTISKKYLIFGILVLLLSFPIYVASFGGRGEVFSVFSYPRTPKEVEEIKIQEAGKNYFFPIFHSEQLNFARSILTRYFNHFSARFLLFEGDFQNKRTQIPAMGMLYFFELPAILLGIFWTIRNKLTGKAFFWYFLAITPVPAVLTRDLVHPIRAANMIIPLAVLSGAGFAYFLESISQTGRFKKSILLIAALVLVWNFFYFFDLYFHHSKFTNSSDWLYGHKEAVQFIEKNKQKYDQIIMTTAFNEPYIFNLFYSKYEPAKFQKQAKLELVRGRADVGEVPGFDKFTFRSIYWPADRDLARTLFIGTSLELPEQDLARDENFGKAKFLREIKFLNGQIAFKIVETR